MNDTLKQSELHERSLPRRETSQWAILGGYLDAIRENADHATYEGYCKRRARKLDTALADIIAAASAARLLLQNINGKRHTFER